MSRQSIQNSPMDVCVRESDAYLLSTEAPTFKPKNKKTPRPTPNLTPNPTVKLNIINSPRPTPSPWTGPPSFLFQGPPPTLAPTTESWSFLLNHSEPVPLIHVGNNGKFDAPYPLGPCQSDCDKDSDCMDNLVCFQRDGVSIVSTPVL